MDVSLYHESLNAFVSILPQNAKVLELACGPGNLTRYLVDKRKDLQVLATDLAEKMLELARGNVPEAVFQKMDCRDISLLNQTFDALVVGFCLPYLSEVMLTSYCIRLWKHL